MKDGLPIETPESRSRQRGRVYSIMGVTLDSSGAPMVGGTVNLVRMARMAQRLILADREEKTLSLRLVNPR